MLEGTPHEFFGLKVLKILRATMTLDLDVEDAPRGSSHRVLLAHGDELSRGRHAHARDALHIRVGAVEVLALVLRRVDHNIVASTVDQSVVVQQAEVVLKSPVNTVHKTKHELAYRGLTVVPGCIPAFMFYSKINLNPGLF